MQVHDRELVWRDAARELKRNLLVREMDANADVDLILTFQTFACLRSSKM